MPYTWAFPRTNSSPNWIRDPGAHMKPIICLILATIIVVSLYRAGVIITDRTNKKN